MEMNKKDLIYSNGKYIFYKKNNNFITKQYIAEINDKCGNCEKELIPGKIYYGTGIVPLYCSIECVKNWVSIKKIEVSPFDISDFLFDNGIDILIDKEK